MFVGRCQSFSECPFVELQKPGKTSQVIRNIRVKDRVSATGLGARTFAILSSDYRQAFDLVRPSLLD